MSKPNLFHGIVIAACLAGAAYALGPLLRFSSIFAVVSYLYILYILARARARVGRLAVGTLAALVLGGVVAAGIAWPSVVLLSVGLIWLSRSLYAYSSLVGAVADAFLCVLALGLASAGLTFSGNLAWGIWCFFLLQALFALIPSHGPSAIGLSPAPDEADSFARAHRAAEMALRQLALRD